MAMEEMLDRNKRAMSEIEKGIGTQFDAPLELFSGLSRYDRDRAADRVTPVKRALRAAQDFDLLHVDQLLRELRRVRHQHAVYEHRDRHLAVARLRYAADVDEGVARILRLDERDVRRQRDEVTRRLDAGRLDLGSRECPYGNGALLQRLSAFPRRNHDLLDERPLRERFGYNERCGDGNE